MSETEDIAQAAIDARSMAQELLRKAQELRKRAEILEKQSAWLAAKAARDLATYLEELVDRVTP